jgi:hypothetical protein
MEHINAYFYAKNTHAALFWPYHMALIIGPKYSKIYLLYGPDGASIFKNMASTITLLT